MNSSRFYDAGELSPASANLRLPVGINQDRESVIVMTANQKEQFIQASRPISTSNKSKISKADSEPVMN